MVDSRSVHERRVASSPVFQRSSVLLPQTGTARWDDGVAAGGSAGRSKQGETPCHRQYTTYISTSSSDFLVSDVPFRLFGRFLLFSFVVVPPFLLLRGNDGSDCLPNAETQSCIHGMYTHLEDHTKGRFTV
ncbi:hypothetical protein GE21DRAFT_1079019 [Neurospora crassa]|nr:hypothetical protein GE21DRAFT_1079019 [Neurospora crassa]